MNEGEHLQQKTDIFRFSIIKKHKKQGIFQYEKSKKSQEKLWNYVEKQENFSLKSQKIC